MEGDRLNILAIDDHLDNLAVLKAVLADSFPGAAVATALDGPAGLALARAEDPDVILLDIVMPEMDGFEVCRRLKDDDRLRHIPVVFLTAQKRDRDNHIRALEVGGEAFLSKPIDEIELTAQIRAMAKIKAASQRAERETERLAGLVRERTRELEEELAERRQTEEHLRLANQALELSRTAAVKLLEDMRRLEADRERVRADYQTLFEKMIDAFAVHEIIRDTEGKPVDYRFLSANPAFERLTGLESRAIAGRTAREVLPGIEPFWIETYGRVALTGEPTSFERYEARMGKYFEVSAFCPAPGQFACVFVDITARKHWDAERESLLSCLDATLEATADGILVVDLEGKIVEYNRRFVDLWGIPQAILDAKDDRKALAFVRDRLCDPAAFSAEVRALYQQPEAESHDELIFKDGRVLERSSRPQYLAGKPAGRVWCFRDVTEHKKTQETQAFLAQHRGTAGDGDFFPALARHLSESLGADFVCIDRLREQHLEAQTVAVYCDGTFQDNVAYALKDTPCGEVVGKTICCFTHDVCELFPNDPVLQEMRAESYIGTTLWSSKGQPIGLIALIWRRALANPEMATSVLGLVAGRAAGELERIEAESAMRRSEARYRGLFEHMTEGCAYCRMIFVDGQARDWIYLAVNQAFQTLTGLGQVEGKRVSEVIPGIREADPELFDLYARVALTGVSERAECFLKSLEMWFAVSVYSPEKEVFVAVFDVITERKQAEHALRKSLAEKESLLKEVHHRVKNNLQIVVSLLHLQSGRIENKLALEALRETQSRVRAMALLHETLYRSADLAHINFQTYLDNLCKYLFRSYGPETSRLQFQLEAAGVELGLEQAVPCGLIVSELVSNTLKHAFPNGRTGALSVALRSEAGSSLRLSVTDTGVGLPPDFDARRARSLGLQLVFNLARQLRGAVAIEPGPGARVVITFPTAPTLSAT